MKSCDNRNISFGPQQMAGRFSRCLAPVLVGAFLATGCHKAAPEAPVPPSSPAAATAPDTNQDASTAYTPQRSPGPPQPTPQPLADPEAPSRVKPNGEPDLHQLDRDIIQWIVGHQRSPSSFAEFASSAGVAIPPPPPGKKYAFTRDMHVILVKAK